MLKIRPSVKYNSFDAALPAVIVYIFWHFIPLDVSWYWMALIYMASVFVLSFFANLLFPPTYSIKPIGTLNIDEDGDKIAFNFILDSSVEELMNEEACVWRINNNVKD